ncbi:hypothetical protein ElyMa_000847100 [Elysia marginata]|uniref:Uncharacterized protein n=1 Tax=Elysia marginata TaxID=1093978 RepID=A0AAV4H0Q2_9GAST|nr:hypothetical protein ElyMa_000847100 [Elysia marginata]
MCIDIAHRVGVYRKKADRAIIVSHKAQNGIIRARRALKGTGSDATARGFDTQTATLLHKVKQLSGVCQAWSKHKDIFAKGLDGDNIEVYKHASLEEHNKTLLAHRQNGAKQHHSHPNISDEVSIRRQGLENTKRSNTQLCLQYSQDSTMKAAQSAATATAVATGTASKDDCESLVEPDQHQPRASTPCQLKSESPSRVDFNPVQNRLLSIAHVSDQSLSGSSRSPY